MDKFSKFSDEELYMLKRQVSISSSHILNEDFTIEQQAVHGNLMIQIESEINKRKEFKETLNNWGKIHKAIIENFNPDDAETDRVLQEATNRTIEKYREE
jgi:hypothetical protein